MAVESKTQLPQKISDVLVPVEFFFLLIKTLEGRTMDWKRICYKGQARFKIKKSNKKLM